MIGMIWVTICVFGVLLAVVAVSTSKSEANAYSATKKQNEQTMAESQHGSVKEVGSYRIMQIGLNGMEIIEYIGFDDTELVIPAHFDGVPVYSIGVNAFHNCLYLEQVSIPEGVTKLQAGAFSGCKNLRNVKLPATLIEVGKEAFQECAMSSITIPAMVTKLGDRAFFNCKNLKDVITAENIKYIGEECFSGTRLQVFHFSKQLEIIERRAFFRTPLIEVYIPENVRKIGTSAFYGCCYLARVVIEDGIKEIGPEAFSNCDNLREVTIPKSVISIDDDSFARKYYKNGDIYQLMVESQNLVMYCYAGSYAMKYAREHGFKCKDAMGK